MTTSDHFLRFDHVTSVAPTETGLVAQLHGERFRVDVCRADVVRLQLSRGGVFDDKPTYAVCVDPLEGARRGEVEWRIESEPVSDAETGAGTAASRWRVVTDDLVVTLEVSPFRVDVHRTDGSPVVTTAVDESGLPATYSTLNDAFEIRRRRDRGDGFFGLGEKGGDLDRSGRDFTLWNTDVLDGDATAEFRAGRSADDPRADMSSVEFDPYYVSIPFFYHQSNPAGTMSGSFVDNGYRGSYEFSRPDEYRIGFEGGQWTEYVFAGPSMAGILEAYTWLTGRASLPPVVVVGLPPVPLARLHAGGGGAARCPPSRERRSVRRLVARHRLHGRVPGLHLGQHSASPTRPACCNGWATMASR